MHQKKKSFIKKSAAVAVSAVLTLTASAGSVFADTSYLEASKEALAELIQSVKEPIETDVSEVEQTFAGSKADISILLDDAGRSLLGLVVPTDISWLSKVGFDMDVTMQDGLEAVNARVYMNDGDICNVEVFVDSSNMVQYLRIPELSDSYLKVPMTVEVTGDDASSQAYANFMESYMGAVTNPIEVSGSADTIGTLLDRYGNLFLNYVTDGPSGEDTISVDGVSQDCQSYQGQITDEDATTMAKELLTTLRDDAEFKEFLDTFGDSASEDENGEDFYTSFQTSIDELLADWDDTTGEPSEQYITDTIWKDADGNVIGRQFSLGEGVSEEPIFTYQAPKNGDQEGLLLELNMDDSSFSLVGSGQVTDSVLNGTYQIVVNSVIVASIEVQNYDKEGAKEGLLNGTYILTPEPGIADEDTYNALSTFAIIVDLVSENESEGRIDLSVTSSGSNLATLRIAGGYGDGVEIPDLDNLEKVYSVENDDDMGAYLEEANVDALFANMVSAGMPQERADQLKTSLEEALAEGTVEESVETLEESLEDSAETTKETTEEPAAEPATDAAA